MAECVELARRLAERAGRELGIPVYLYEQAATTPGRRNLADVRAGEYEGLAAKLADPAWQPDFGPATFLPRSGASVVGARPFLVAYNVNLNTVDKRLATRIAGEIREKGKKRLDAAGKPMKDAAGAEIWDAGLLAGIKAVGWTIPEFGCAQISINVTDLEATPLHVVFDTCDERARAHGLRVTGSELVGLVPRAVLLDAGRHYLARMGRSTGVPESALIHVAVRTLGLAEVKPFDPRAAIIEARLAAMAEGAPLLRHDARRIRRRALHRLAGSGRRVGRRLRRRPRRRTRGDGGQPLPSQARLTRRSRRTLERVALRGQAIKDRLLAAVDADTAAFDRFLAAMRMPKESARRNAPCATRR